MIRWNRPAGGLAAAMLERSRKETKDLEKEEKTNLYQRTLQTLKNNNVARGLATGKQERAAFSVGGHADAIVTAG